MSVAVTPQSVGSSGSMLVHLSEPTPRKFSLPFWNKGRFMAAGIVLFGVFLGLLAVNSAASGKHVEASIFLGVAALFMFYASFDRYMMWVWVEEAKYVKNTVVPFFKRELFAAVPGWLSDAGLAVYNGEAPRLYDEFNGEQLYNSLYGKNPGVSVGQWMRAWDVAADGTATDSGKAYSVGFTPVGKDVFEVTYEVVDI